MREKYRLTGLGRILRMRRKSLRLTQNECARKLDVRKQTISQIEHGLNRLNNDRNFKRLAKILKFDVESLRKIKPQRRLCQKKRNTPLGNFLTTRRLRVHLFQHEVARWAGVDVALISAVERGRRSPKHSTLKKIAWVLECKIPTKLFPPKRLRKQRKKKM